MKMNLRWRVRNCWGDKMSVKCDIKITFSKIVALLVLIFSGFLTFWTNNSNIFIIGCSCASAILVNKEYQQTKWMNKDEK